MYLGVAIGALVGGGHSFRSARKYLARDGWNENDDEDDPVVLMVRGALAAILMVLGTGADLTAFIDGASIWRIYESGEADAFTRKLFSPEAAQRIVNDYKRARRPQLRLVGDSMEC
ncbi:MAG: hypothetical protein R3B09_01705 [Nannocystaceae bacterium]